MERVVLSEQSGYNRNDIVKYAARMFETYVLELDGREAFIYFCCDQSPDGRYVGTHPEVVIGSVLALKELGAARITVADATPAGKPFWGCGFSDEQISILKSQAVVVKLATAPHTSVEVRGINDLSSFSVPRCWYNSEFFLCLPKLKTDLFADAHTTPICMLSLSPPKQRQYLYNYLLHERAAQFYRVRKPDFVIYDAVTAGQGQGPLNTQPVETNLLFGGTNSQAVDVVGCSLMGISPSDVDHLRILWESGRGPISKNDIQLINNGLFAKHASHFARAEWEVSGVSRNIHVSGGDRRYCGPGCAGMARQALDPWLDRKGPDGLEEMHLIIGRPIKSLAANFPVNRTLVIGGCAADFEEEGIYFPDIPPDPRDVELAVMHIQAGKHFAGALSKAVLLERAGLDKEIMMKYLRRKAFGLHDGVQPLSKIRLAFLLFKGLLMTAIGKQGRSRDGFPSRCLDA